MTRLVCAELTRELAALRKQREALDKQVEAIETLSRRQRSAHEPPTQRFAVEELGNQIGRMHRPSLIVHHVGAADVVHRDDVGMVDGGDRARLPLEPRQAIRVARERGRQDLDRDVAPEPRVARLVDDAHATGADKGHDFVGPEPRAGRQCHGWRQSISQLPRFRIRFEEHFCSAHAHVAPALGGPRSAMIQKTCLQSSRSSRGSAPITLRARKYGNQMTRQTPHCGVIPSLASRWISRTAMSTKPRLAQRRARSTNSSRVCVAEDRRPTRNIAGERSCATAWLRDSATFTGRPVSSQRELIITPGTQGALFLAIGATVTAGDRVAIVRPDYFANRKLVEFLGAEIVPVPLDYLGHTDRAGLDLDRLEDAFKSGVKTFLFSNPNNPAGVIYSPDEIARIGELATQYGVTVIVDELYSRLLYSGQTYTHLRATAANPDQVVTIMGPSKTESLSGYRLGVAFGAAHLIDRMEKLQAIVSLRAPGYSQAVLRGWFEESPGWMAERTAKHQAIRDDLVKIFRSVAGVAIRTPQAGSYLFPRLPGLSLPLHEFVRALRVQASVTVTPGTEFSPDATDSIRLNFSQNHEAAVRAVERIAQMIARYRTA